MRLKPGRRSAADLAASPLPAAASRLRPPDHLGSEEAKIFRTIVAESGPRHFVATDVHLLAAYCEAIVISRWAAAALRKDQGAAAVWERTVRVLATLATRLRLAPQARTDPKTVGRNTPAMVSAYDLLGITGKESKDD